MASDTITLELNGEVSLGAFAEALGHLRRLLDGLSAEKSGEARIEWTVEQLSAGSVLTMVRGDAEQMESVERVADAYLEVGRYLHREEEIPYPDDVKRAAHALTKVLNGKITSIRFETSDDEVEIFSGSARQPARVSYAYGAVEGRVRTLSDRKGLRFQLYDAGSDHPVMCYLARGQEDLMRNAWGRRAIVEGYVGRNPVTGVPTRIRNVSHVDVLPDKVPGSYRAARGVLRSAGREPAEETIRRLRDAW